MSASIRFSNAEVRPSTRQLLVKGRPTVVGARAFDLLLALIERRDRLVTKAELFDLVWPGVVVEENNLQVQVSSLRKLLGPQTIATIPGRGYRFTGVLEGEPGGEVGPESPADGVSQPLPDEAGLGAAGAAPPDRAPIRAARELRHNLPAERDAFVGRSTMLSELGQRFDRSARLVSLLGIGGCGKTRLALHFGRAKAGEWAGGVWFCDLAPARTFEGVLHAVAQGLGVPLGGADAVMQLGQAIAARGACLVILDNFEQVARYAEETLGRWLERAAEARFLVTSREVLGIAGEEALALPPLPIPDAEDLFLRRAAAARLDFDPPPEDRAAIGPLVRLLDGLPLAIELAAARVLTLTLRSLLARMSERFRLLTSNSGRLDRQATLRATFDWSWDLLSVADKAALAQCSVFEGGFNLEAAEAVVDLSSIADAPWLVDVMQSLVHKSFVRPCGDGRFDLLVSVQAYAAEHLQAEGRFPGSGAAALQAARQRHGEWFAALGPGRAMEARCADLHNLVAACRRNLAAGNAASAAGALEGAWAALNLQGPFKAAADLAEAVCAMPGLQGAAAAHAHAVLGHVTEALGMPAQAAEHYETALRHARAANDRPCEAAVTVNLAALHADAGDPEAARSEHARALELARAAGDAALQCAALNGLGTVEFGLGRMDQAQVHYEAALKLARGRGDRRWQGRLLGNLGNLHASVGRMDEARAHSEQSLLIARELDDRKSEGNTLCNLGMLHHVQRRHDDARGALEAALELARELGYARLECIVLCNLGLVHDATDRPALALSAYADALAVAQRIGDRHTEGQVLGYLGVEHARQRAIDEARECLDRGQVLLREAADALSLGILLCGRAECEWLAGDTRAAEAARREATELATQAGAGPDSELGLALARVSEMLASKRA